MIFYHCGSQYQQKKKMFQNGGSLLIELISEWLHAVINNHTWPEMRKGNGSWGAHSNQRSPRPLINKPALTTPLRITQNPALWSVGPLLWESQMPLRRRAKLLSIAIEMND